MEYTLLKMLPLRLMIELLMQERQSPATAQVVNSYTEGKDWIPFMRWDINHSFITGQEMSLLTSCTAYMFSDFCPCPVDQLSAVARMLTGIIKGTLLRKPESLLSLSACPSRYLPYHLLALGSLLLWTDLLELWEILSPGTDSRVWWFLCSTCQTISGWNCQQNAKPIFKWLLQMQFFILAPEVFQFCTQTYMEVLEYSNTVLAGCPVICHLYVVKLLKSSMFLPFHK